MDVPFDWAEISKSTKGVRTSDNKACGIVVSIAGDDIWIVDVAERVYCRYATILYLI